LHGCARSKLSKRSLEIPLKVRDWCEERAFSGDSGEVNATKLAEDAADEFDLYEPDGETIPEYLFDYTAEVADIWDEEGNRFL
jgi:hypothetical protein